MDKNAPNAGLLKRATMTSITVMAPIFLLTKDNFLPSGYMAIIHDIHYWDNHRQTTCQARMMCVGSLVADYQSFYKELGVSSFV